MALSLLGLPFELLEIVFEKMDSESLVAMRRVSKITKELAEVTVLNGTQRISFDSITLNGEMKDEVAIDFTFNRVEKNERLISKLFLLSVINYHRVPQFNLYSKRMSTVMTRFETVSFFDRLTPLMKDTECASLDFYPETLQTFSLFSNFFEGKTVPELYFDLDESEQKRNLLLQTMDKLNSTAVQLHLNVHSQFPDAFLLEEVATKVDALSISSTGPYWLTNFWDTPNLPVIFLELLSIRILKRRCSYLDLSNACIDIPSHKIMEIRNLVKFEMKEKEFYLSLSTTEEKLKKKIKYETIVEVSKKDTNSKRNLLEVRHPKMIRRKW